VSRLCRSFFLVVTSRSDRNCGLSATTDLSRVNKPTDLGTCRVSVMDILVLFSKLTCMAVIAEHHPSGNAVIHINEVLYTLSMVSTKIGDCSRVCRFGM